MDIAVYNWLGEIGSAAFRWSAGAFVVANVVAIAAFAITKDRSIVNRWTGRLLGVNLLLAGTGLGIPLVTSATRLAIAVVVPGGPALIPTVLADDPQSAEREAEIEAEIEAGVRRR